MKDYHVRDGKKVAPTCPECGCRLTTFEDIYYHWLNKDLDRDARGHKCSLLNSWWESAQDFGLTEFNK